MEAKNLFFKHFLRKETNIELIKNKQIRENVLQIITTSLLFIN